MRQYENFCVGCPQGCIHCGREHDVLVISCDKCGEDIVPIYEYKGLELCMDCIMEDGEPGECDGCGANDVLVDGLCRECLVAELDEIREE